MKRTTISLLFLIFVMMSVAGGAYAQVPLVNNVNPLPSNALIGDTILARIPLTAGGDPGMAHLWRTHDATGSLIVSVTGTESTSLTSGAIGHERVFEYQPTVAGQLIFSVSHESLPNVASWSTRVEPSGVVSSSTMYYLAAAITRSSTWTVADPIKRYSPAWYESLLWETHSNHQGEVIGHRVAIFDYVQSVTNFVDQSSEFWRPTVAGVIELMSRAVPDGDTDRYMIGD